MNGSRGKTLTAQLISALLRFLLLADTVRAMILLLTWHELNETQHA